MSAWDDAEMYRAEHERMRLAAEHVARAVAELLHAQAQVGDHASAVALREAAESLQLTQSQLASAAEKAFSLGQLAARRARQEAMERQVNEAQW
jgi:hypothetical protein